jgi:hypothetical protein
VRWLHQQQRLKVVGDYSAASPLVRNTNNGIGNLHRLLPLSAVACVERLPCALVSPATAAEFLPVTNALTNQSTFTAL